jgi:hypothetical protein
MFLGSSPVGTSFNININTNQSKKSCLTQHHHSVYSNQDYYLWIFLQFQGLLINILALVRNHNPRINGARFFTSLHKIPLKMNFES